MHLAFVTHWQLTLKSPKTEVRLNEVVVPFTGSVFMFHREKDYFPGWLMLTA